jgi:hypothetical protein
VPNARIPATETVAALTDPAQLMLWWVSTPKGALWEMDARPGGKWRYELTDRSGLRFRTKYRDVLEMILTFGGGDLLAVDNHQNVIKRWDNIIGLFFFWNELDRILHQRAAVMDTGDRLTQT